MWDKIHDEILPNALMIGVQYELFWELNPRSFAPFVKAFKLKREYDDTLAWQHGTYIRMAIASCFGKNVQYPPKPFMMKSKVSKVDPVSQQQIIKERFMAHARLLNQRMKKDGDEF